MPTIDLNCDAGEHPSPDIDASLAPYVTSFNIACGGHTGDASTMRRTIDLCLAHNLSIGAHPSYPDRENFGRTPMALSPRDIERTVFEQTATLYTLAKQAGSTLSHLKPHGALYHAAMHDLDIAAAIARAAALIDPSIILVGQSNAPALAHWHAANHRTAAEAFADRIYEPDGSLRSRTKPHALIENPSHAVAQALRIANDSAVMTAAGTIIPLKADTLCVHSDTPGSAQIAKAIRNSLTLVGVNFLGVGKPQSP